MFYNSKKIYRTFALCATFCFTAFAMEKDTNLINQKLINEINYILSVNNSLTLIRVKDDDISVIAEKLRLNNAILNLDFSKGSISCLGAHDLVKALSHNSSLQGLNLYDNQIGKQGAKSIAELLKKPAFAKLCLTKNPIGDEGIPFISLNLIGNAVLHTLNLDFCKLTYVGAENLARGLKYNAALKSLHLQGNDLGDKGVSAIVGALIKHSSIHFLDFSSTMTTDVGASKLAEFLLVNKSLESLYLASNKISNEGGKALAVALGSNNKLRNLYLHANSIQDEANSDICDLLRKNEKFSAVVRYFPVILNFKAGWEDKSCIIARFPSELVKDIIQILCILVINNN
jgi:Ran GTPase-activating protein (RanGAP) involved in mRNA processing and transport